VVGTVLFIGLFILVFRYFLKRRTKKRLLKEEVSKALLRMETNEDKRGSLWTRYRLLLFSLTYKPTKIDDDINRLNNPIEKETIRLRDFFSLKPRGFWELPAFFYESDLIPDGFLRPPKLTIKGLERKLEELQKLSDDQKELITVFEDKTDSKMSWKNEQGESILISKVEWHSNMRVAGDLKEEKEFDEAMTKAEIDGAKARLQKAIDYVNTRQSGESLKVGEHSITRGARYLNFKEVKKFCKEALEKVAALEQESANSESIINFCNVASLNLGQNFEDWAEKIFDRQFSFDEIRGYLKQLGESRKVEIVADKELANQMMNLFQVTIPENWNAANWEFLQIDIDNADTTLHEIGLLTKDLEYWEDEISKLEVRIQAVLTKEKRLEEDYGIARTPSREWSNALAHWNDKVSSFWANGQQDELEDTLRNLETPLMQHSYKVGNKLDEAENLAGVTTQTIIDGPSKKVSTNEDVAARLADIAQAGQPSANQHTRRRRRPSSFEPETKLTGKTVTVMSHGIPIEVDSSLEEHYQREEPADPKEKKKKHTK
jgi:hypothetical protein